MKWQWERKENLLVVYLEGELDLHTVPQVKKAVEEEMKQKRIASLLLDLKKVSFMDSSGLGFILGRYRSLQDKGGQVLLSAPGAQVRRVLDLAGVGHIIPIYESVEGACQAREGN